jgi:hypothetical protein
MKRFTWLLIAVFALTMSAACGGKKEDKGGKKGGTAEKGDKGGKKGGGGATIDEAKAKELAAIEVAGFKSGGARATKTMAMPSYDAEAANEKGKKIHVDVMAQGCVACMPLDVEKWKANPNLKSMLPKIHKDNPDLVWEVEEIEAAGLKGISIYKRSFASSNEGKTKGTAHGVQVHYHNGVNQLVLTVSARGGGMANSAEELAASVSKDEFVAAAKKFLEAFGPKI